MYILAVAFLSLSATVLLLSQSRCMGCFVINSCSQVEFDLVCLGRYISTYYVVSMYEMIKMEKSTKNNRAVQPDRMDDSIGQ